MKPKRRGDAPEPVDSPWMRPRDAAAYLGMSEDAIYDACHGKGLKYSKLGHATMRLRREWLDEWVESHIVPPPEPPSASPPPPE